jgi:hypothetical protein
VLAELKRHESAPPPTPDNVNPGESIWLGPGRQDSVLSVIHIDEDEGSPYSALLMIEPCGS